jgi:hypothetical protein
MKSHNRMLFRTSGDCQPPRPEFERRTLLLSLLTITLMLTGCAGGGGVASTMPMPDFSISVSPSSTAAEVGGTTPAVTLSLIPENGFAGSASVTVSGFPLGITVSPASPFNIQPGMTQPVTFSAPAAAGTFDVNFIAASAGLSHTTSVSLKVTPKPSPYLVAASYYPWYIDELGPNHTWDYLECAYGSLRQELVPQELPMLGQYNSRDQNVVTQQIAWSSAAGLNVWALEWAPPELAPIDDVIRNVVLQNPHIGDMHFAIFYDYAVQYGSDFNITPAKINKIAVDFSYMAKTYFSHPSYLKVEQGRPVVFFYLTRALNPLSSVQQMAAGIRKAASDAGFNIFIIADEYYAGNPPDPAHISLWDGIFGYDVYVGHAGYSDDNGYLTLHSTMYDEYTAVTQQLGVEFVGSLMPGFNNRATRRVCMDIPALARRTSATAPEGSMFRSFLRDVVLPHLRTSKLKMMHITSFNEWREDSEIEPTVITGSTTRDTSATGTQYTQGLIYQGYGTTYLDILREELANAP